VKTLPISVSALRGSPSVMVRRSVTHRPISTPVSTMTARPSFSSARMVTVPRPTSRSMMREEDGGSTTVRAIGGPCSGAPNLTFLSRRGRRARTGSSSTLAPVASRSVTGSGAGQTIGQ
jgi:hypothetical protein